MGERTDQIESQIETKREDLRSNLRELETRVKSATDWRHYFRQHTGTMIAVAFGGGVLLSALTRSRTASKLAGAASEGIRAATPGTRHEVHKTFDSITSALLGVAAAKFKSVLGNVVPGFSDQLVRSEEDRGRDATH